MPGCDHCGADGAKLRCTKCKSVFYCSRNCQSWNWRQFHKHVCKEDPGLRPFIRVEMAIERILAKMPKVQAPKDATCYICLEGEDGGKLMRGCACRGDSAGFVHLECLKKLAASKEGSSDPSVSWLTCVNCHQPFTFALEIEVARLFWRRYRSSRSHELRYYASRLWAAHFATYNEIDAAAQMHDEACTYAGRNTLIILDMKTSKARFLLENGRQLEALELLQGMLPQAKAYITTNPGPYYHALLESIHVQHDLGRDQEAHEAAAELVTVSKAKFGLEHQQTLVARKVHAIACAKLGRMAESKAIFQDVLTTETRVCGRDNPNTQQTRAKMLGYGFLTPAEAYM